MIKIDEKLRDLRHFQDIFEKWIPKNKKITKIWVMPPSEFKIARFMAQLGTTDERTYDIALYLYYWRYDSLKPLKRTLKPYSTIDILKSVAHELAHLHEWDHTPMHQIIESKINIEFQIRLMEFGHESEENELRHKKLENRANFSIIP